MSWRQSKRALELLRKLGLIETEQHLFGGRNILHVRLIGRGLDLVKPTPPGPAKGPATDRKGAAQGARQGRQHGGSTKQGDTTESYGNELPTGVLASSHASSPGDREGSGPGNQASLLENSEPAMKVKDVLANLHKPDPGASLEVRWKQAVAAATGKYVGP